RALVAAERLPLGHPPDAGVAGRGIGEENRACRERAAIRLGDADPLHAEPVGSEVHEVGLAVGLGVRDARLLLVDEPGVPEAALVLVGLLDPAGLRVREDPARER